MANKNNYNRRQFLQHSALGAAAAAFPGLLWGQMGQIKTAPTPGFNPDVEIEFSARQANVQILNSGPTTRVQKYYARLLKGPKQSQLTV